MSTPAEPLTGSPFADEGLWLRCALHAHTTNSDGELAPDVLVRHYEWAGFDVLAITDHWVRTDERSTRRLLVLPSAELNAAAGGTGRDAHVLAFGLEADPVPPENEFAPLPEVVAWISANGGVPSHHPGFDSGVAWTMVRAAERSREAVLDALRGGRFYASNGPELLDLRIDADEVVVRSSPAASVTLLAGGRGARANAGRLGYRHASEILERTADGSITACRLERPWDSPYGRLEVADAAGRRAWTNPLWIA